MSKRINLGDLDLLWLAALLLVALMFNTCGGWSQAERLAETFASCSCEGVGDPRKDGAE